MLTLEVDRHIPGEPEASQPETASRRFKKHRWPTGPMSDLVLCSFLFCFARKSRTKQVVIDESGVEDGHACLCTYTLISKKANGSFHFFFLSSLAFGVTKLRRTQVGRQTGYTEINK